jgi:hypothetical protein
MTQLLFHGLNNQKYQRKTKKKTKKRVPSECAASYLTIRQQALYFYHFGKHHSQYPTTNRMLLFLFFPMF